MSAGVCILNKHAVALAADSAVTIGDHLAIHNSANKLFAVSKIAPVGVITYANAEVMGIPVEVLLKQFKIFLGNASYDSLSGYADCFIQFLTKQAELLQLTAYEPFFVKNVYRDLFLGLQGDYDIYIKSKLEIVKNALSEQDITEIIDKAITDTISFANSCPPLSNFSVADYICEHYGGEIEAYIKEHLKWVPHNRIDELKTCVCQLFDKNFFRSGYTGFAFAGYGNKEIYPGVKHISISGVINGKVRYAIKQQEVISQVGCNGLIVPLAQSDVMETFLTGIAQSILEKLSSFNERIARKVDNWDTKLFTDGKKDQVKILINKAIETEIKSIHNDSNSNHLQPILNSIATLQIDELSMLAESLINITSLRRQVAIDRNVGTVGGPIDVAIITKGDGMVWIKRKHYFSPEYNPQFFFNHYINNGDSENETEA